MWMLQKNRAALNAKAEQNVHEETASVWLTQMPLTYISKESLLFAGWQERSLFRFARGHRECPCDPLCPHCAVGLSHFPEAALHTVWTQSLCLGHSL